MDPAVETYLRNMQATSTPPVLPQLALEVMVNPPSPGDPSYETYTNVGRECLWNHKRNGYCYISKLYIVHHTRTTCSSGVKPEHWDWAASFVIHFFVFFHCFLSQYWDHSLKVLCLVAIRLHCKTTWKQGKVVLVKNFPLKNYVAHLNPDTSPVIVKLEVQKEIKESIWPLDRFALHLVIIRLIVMEVMTELSNF